MNTAPDGSLYVFVRTIYNGYEPDNLAYIWGERQGNELLYRKVLFDATFRDGECPCSIIPTAQGFAWHNNHLHGVAVTIEEAWRHMPALLTHPDHYDDTPHVPVPTYETTESIHLLWNVLRRQGIPLSPKRPVPEADLEAETEQEGDAHATL